MSWSNGFYRFGIRWGGGYYGAYRPWRCCGGWYGGGYRGPVIVNTGNINIGNNINVGNRANVRNELSRSSSFDLENARNNIYNRPENRARNADATAARRNLKQARAVESQANNVFADRNGNIARRTDQGWESRQNGQWSRENVPSGALDNARDKAQSSSFDNARNAAQNRGLPGSNRQNVDWSGLNNASAARNHGFNRQMSRPQTRRPTGRRR